MFWVHIKLYSNDRKRPHTAAVSWHAKSQGPDGVGNGVGVIGEGTPLKVIPPGGGVGESAAVRMMVLGLDAGLLAGSCATAAGTEDGESEADKLTVGVG